MARTTQSPLIVALDLPGEVQTLDLVDRLDPTRCRLKVGMEQYTRTGSSLVHRLQDRGFDVFLDLKFHDIPNTVAAACGVAADLGVWMVNVHCSGGPRMIAAARERLETYAHRPLLVGVTILTSLDTEDLTALGCPGEPLERVLQLAELGRRSGLDGVVCSPHEAAVVRVRCGADFLLVTPGVRPALDGADDQKRVMTPTDALAQGADYLVVGRPITAAPDPMAALEAIEQSLTP